MSIERAEQGGVPVSGDDHRHTDEALDCGHPNHGGLDHACAPFVVSAPQPLAGERHDPTWLHARQYGRWCECSCGWVSPNGTISFAQDAFGRHLLDLSPILEPSHD
jgi:hypothetical protein